MSAFYKQGLVDPSHSGGPRGRTTRRRTQDVVEKIGVPFEVIKQKISVSINFNDENSYVMHNYI